MVNGCRRQGCAGPMKRDVGVLLGLPFPVAVTPAADSEGGSEAGGSGSGSDEGEDEIESGSSDGDGSDYAPSD